VEVLAAVIAAVASEAVRAPVGLADITTIITIITVRISVGAGVTDTITSAEAADASVPLREQYSL
jgi:hypothetical protein